MTCFDQMRADELPLVLDWAANEGWNPGLEDAEAFFRSDPEGFFVARIDNEPIAAISVVNHSEEFAFLGLYICLPECRGNGIGKAIWDHAVGHAGVRTIGLDAVPAQQKNYTKCGFAAVGETTRYIGKITGALNHLRAAQPSDIGWIKELERKANGYSKNAFLEGWCVPSETRFTFVLDPEQGFATVRKCRVGAKIGPLVARNAQAAKTLMQAAAQAFNGPTIIDVPSDNTKLSELCRALGMTSDFTTARMYRGQSPEPGQMLRAVATLELG